MALPAVNDAAYPDPEVILAQLLAAVRWQYSRIGVTVNVSKGSELYMRMAPLATQVSVAINNNRLALADVSPLDATGDALVAIAGVFGVTARAAAYSAGNVIIGVSVGTVTIPQGFKCTAPNGIEYEVPVAVTVGTGAYVAVQAMTTGLDTNQSPGTLLTWNSAAIGTLQQVCTVDPGGIDGGADADDEETLRRRLLDRLSDPSVGGNWSQTAAWAEEASAAVQKAFVYPGVRGPSSYDVAIVGATGDRSLSTTHVALAASAILAAKPGSANQNATSVTPEEVDVIHALTLPLPVNAGGAGGGWKDAAPWPSTADTALARITAVNPGAKQITVNSTNLDMPVVGKRFAVWDPTNEEMHEYTIQVVAGASGAYVLTLTEAPSLTFPTTWMYCSAAGENLNAYAKAFKAACMLLGPGEKTANPDIVPRASRHPRATDGWPSALTSIQIASVTTQYAEIQDLVYQARYAGGTITPLTAPTMPAVTNAPPRILVLNALSF